jgi:deazaflavin-dependent oxidoreductase (nitroreductase family)
LKTIGRKSGKARILPLIYGDTGGEVVIVASKGGADVHPAWYLNLREQKEVEFQIGGQAFRGTWREPQGAERAEIWAFMEKLYPPYVDYQKATKREIPLVVMSAGDEIPVFKE